MNLIRFSIGNTYPCHFISASCCKQSIWGILPRAPSESEKLFEVQCRYFAAKEELTVFLPAHRHFIHVVHILQNGG